MHSMWLAINFQETQESVVIIVGVGVDVLLWPHQTV